LCSSSTDRRIFTGLSIAGRGPANKTATEGSSLTGRDETASIEATQVIDENGKGEAGNKKAMASILVTGGAGYVGSHTCKALRRAGFDPVTYDNLVRGNPESVKWGALEIGELTDSVHLRETLAHYRPAAVVHFAALAYVGESNLNPSAYYQNNVGGTAALLGAMREAGVGKIVFSSSCAVYGAPVVGPIPEETPYAPINPYGATKMICERMLQECSTAFPLSFVALRYFNAAGADPEGEIGECHVPETHAIPLLLEAAAGESKGFTIFGDDYPTADGTCVRDYVHVTDLADAHVTALRALLDGAESTSLNLGTGRGWSVRELVAKVRDVTGCDFPVLASARRPGDPPVLTADASRARHQLSWRPKYADPSSQIMHAWVWRQGAGKTWRRIQKPPATVAS
jgi:UDP-arabinose 4-epimerase